MEVGTITSQQELCAMGFLFNLFWKLHVHSLTNEFPDCSSSAHPVHPCTSCSDPLCKVLLLQMFPCLPTQLPSVEWGFFWLRFVCLSLCLFGCLGFIASVELLVLPVAETAGPFSELDVCTFSNRLSNEKKIYFLLIYYNGTKTTKLQTYEAFLL